MQQGGTCIRTELELELAAEKEWSGPQSGLSSRRV